MEDHDYSTKYPYPDQFVGSQWENPESLNTLNENRAEYLPFLANDSRCPEDRGPPKFFFCSLDDRKAGAFLGVGRGEECRGSDSRKYFESVESITSILQDIPGVKNGMYWCLNCAVAHRIRRRRQSRATSFIRGLTKKFSRLTMPPMRRPPARDESSYGEGALSFLSWQSASGLAEMPADQPVGVFERRETFQPGGIAELEEGFGMLATSDAGYSRHYELSGESYPAELDSVASEMAQPQATGMSMSAGGSYSHPTSSGLYSFDENPLSQISTQPSEPQYMPGMCESPTEFKTSNAASMDPLLGIQSETPLMTAGVGIWPPCENSWSEALGSQMQGNMNAHHSFVRYPEQLTIDLPPSDPSLDLLSIPAPGEAFPPQSVTMPSRDRFGTPALSSFDRHVRSAERETRQFDKDYAAGARIQDLPSDWTCPHCGYTPPDTVDRRKLLEKHYRTNRHKRKAGQEPSPSFTCGFAAAGDGQVCTKVFNRADNLQSHAKLDHKSSLCITPSDGGGSICGKHCVSKLELASHKRVCHGRKRGRTAATDLGQPPGSAMTKRRNRFEMG